MDAAVQGAGSIGAAKVNPSETAARSKRAEAAPGIGATLPASLDAIPGSPPPEVLDQMAHAQRAYEKLAREGQSLQFGHDDAGRVTVELHGEDGQVSTLSLSEALALASGESPE
jgi:hypothetical protein